MSALPLPARLVQLWQLPSFDVGTKVRFLGCVHSYNTTTGLLVLSLPLPSLRESLSAPKISGFRDQPVVAVLDTALVREDLSKKDTAVGVWLNVAGYIQKLRETHDAQGVKIQALNIWEADSVNIKAYHAAVQSRAEQFPY